MNMQLNGSRDVATSEKGGAGEVCTILVAGQEVPGVKRRVGTLVVLDTVFTCHRRHATAALLEHGKIHNHDRATSSASFVFKSKIIWKREVDSLYISRCLPSNKLGHGTRAINVGLGIQWLTLERILSRQWDQELSISRQEIIKIK